MIACECERTVEPNLSQTLSLMNGDTVNSKVGQSDGRIAKMIAAHKPYDTILNELYIGALGRPPRREERMQVMGALAFAPEPNRFRGRSAHPAQQQRVFVQSLT